MASPNGIRHGDPAGRVPDDAAFAAGPCPLDALRDVHIQHRQHCHDLETLSGNGPADRAAARRLLAGLGPALDLHLADEEEGLFPLLRARSCPEDELGPLLDRLVAEHRQFLTDRPGLIALIGPLAEGGSPDAAGRALLAALALRIRRHMALENAVVLPLARLRLTAADCAGLRTAMCARRGLPVASLRPVG